MSDADDYRTRSAQCFRLAETACSPLQRNAMLDTAVRAWGARGRSSFVLECVPPAAATPVAGLASIRGWCPDLLAGEGVVMRKIVAIALLLAVFFFGALFVMNSLWPTTAPSRRPALAAVPPLETVTRSSVIVAPVAVAQSAIRDALEAQAPRNLAGKKDNPLSQLLSNADIGWTVSRGPLSVAGRSDALVVSTVLNGTLHVTGQLGNVAGSLSGNLGGLINQSLGQNLQRLTGKTIDQRADFRGNVTVSSRPGLTANWRLEPNLTAQVSLADASMSLAGVPLNVGNEVKPFLDRAVNEQVNALQGRLRDDPVLEQTARREWDKMCRSIPLRAAGTGLSNLWLELRPTHAFAAQPHVDPTAVILTIGVQAETRIVPTETRPSCPFPAQLEIVPRTEQGRVNIAVPIDIPFTDIDRLLEAQLIGKTYPQDGSGPVEITVRRASLAASGDRLLISLRVKAREKRSWFGLGAEADIHVWGRPVLDSAQQLLRLTDIELDVQSEAAFGLLGAAAQAARPQLRDALAERAVIDLKPFAAEAKKEVAAAVADFGKQESGVRIDAAINDLRLVGIAFDATTLRVIAEAAGAVKVAVSSISF
jgi:hypothetical protein